jgi:hypothetical protein
VLVIDSRTISPALVHEEFGSSEDNLARKSAFTPVKLEATTKEWKEKSSEMLVPISYPPPETEKELGPAAFVRI